MAKQGWIEQRPGKRGVTFRVKYWAPDESGHLVDKSASFPSWAYGGNRKAEDAAKAYLAKMLTAVRSGTYMAPVTMTLRELVDTWLAVRMEDVSASTTYQYRSAIKNHLHPYPEIGNVPIQRLSAMHLQTHYANLRASGVGAGITGTVRRAIKAALYQAIKWKLITANPAVDVSRQTDRPQEIRFWTPEQSAAFLSLEGIDPKCGLIWRLMLLTGMRVGELIGLRWSDIDLNRKTLTIARTLTRSHDGGFVIGETTKTPNSRRTLTIPESCVEPLKRHKVHQRERQLAAPYWLTDDGDVVFTQSKHHGRRVRYNTLNTWFQQAVKRSGLPVITMHGMRHSFATAMLINGVHPKVVSSLLGDTVEMVLRVYSHVIEVSRQDAIATLDTQISQLQSETARATSDAT